MKKSGVLGVFLIGLLGGNAHAWFHSWASGPNGKCHVDGASSPEAIARHYCEEHHIAPPGSPGACSDSGSSGASAPSGGTYSSDPLLNAAGTLGNAVGEAAGKQLYNTLFGPKKAKTTTPSEDWTRQQQELEKQRRAEREAEAAREAAEQRKRQQEKAQADSADLQVQMRSIDYGASKIEKTTPDIPRVNPTGLQLRGYDHSLSDMSTHDITPVKSEFKAYHDREQEAENAPKTLARKLTKEQEDWCKMNRPLYPTQPIQPIPDDEYEDMKYRYRLRKQEWDDKCMNAAPELGPEQAATPVKSGKMRKDQLSDFKTVGGMDGGATLKGPKPPGPENDKAESGSGFDSGGALRVPAGN